MEDILKSTVLEYDKSTFLIDLREEKAGKEYVKSRENIEGNKGTLELKINIRR